MFLPFEEWILIRCCYRFLWTDTPILICNLRGILHLNGRALIFFAMGFFKKKLRFALFWLWFFLFWPPLFSFVFLFRYIIWIFFPGHFWMSFFLLLLGERWKKGHWRITQVDVINLRCFDQDGKRNVKRFFIRCLNWLKTFFMYEGINFTSYQVIWNKDVNYL